MNLRVDLGSGSRERTGVSYTLNIGYIYKALAAAGVLFNLRSSRRLKPEHASFPSGTAKACALPNLPAKTSSISFAAIRCTC